MRIVGVVVSGEKIIVVDALTQASGPLAIQMDDVWTLQKGGNKAQSYDVMYHRMVDYISENKIEKVVVKASAGGRSAATNAMLNSAELRGVIIAACQACECIQISKQVISKTFGDRNADEYLSDNNFWSKNMTGKAVRIGSREAALMILAGL